MPDRTFELRAEAVMCLWEAVLEDRDSPLWARLFERLGTPTVRHAVIALASPLLDAWDALTEDEQYALIPYDWEFVPIFLTRCVEWDEDGRQLPFARPDAVAILRDIAAE